MILFGISAGLHYLCSMIYPKTFETKIGFDEIRTLLRERCLSTLGKERIDNMTFSSDAEVINEWLQQVKEFRRLQEEADDFPMQYFFDVRESVARLRLEGTHLDEGELFDLRRSRRYATSSTILTARTATTTRKKGHTPTPRFTA